MIKRLLIATTLVGLTALPAAAAGRDFINWNKLHNPILSYPHWSIKDCAMAYRSGTFYIFFSAFYKDHGRIRSHVVEVSTRDFKTYSHPIFDFDGLSDGWIGMCSPDVQWMGKEYEVYTLLNNHNWLDWGKGPQLKIPAQGFNKFVHADAAAMCDWRKKDGFSI